MLQQFYSRYSYDTHTLESVPPFIFKRMRQILAPLSRFRQQGRFLELGFGAGATLSVARDLGWEAHGIESSSLAVEHARRHGFVVTEGDARAVAYPDGHFDVLVMCELLEHTLNPAEVLAEAARVLRPGGALYMTTPNGAGMSARFLGVDWTVVCPPEHLHLFSPRSLTDALRRADFTDVDIRTEGLGHFEIIQKARRSLRKPEKPAAASERNQAAYAVNERLESSARGRFLKGMANLALRLAMLGDTLKATAVRRQ